MQRPQLAAGVAGHRQHLRAGSRRARGRRRGQRRQLRPPLPALVDRHRQARRGMRRAIGGQRQRVGRRRQRLTLSRPVARRSVKSSGSTSSSGVPTSPARSNDRAPSTSRPPPRGGDERRGHLQLIAAEEIAFDVAEDDRVVAEQLGALGRIAGGERAGAAARRLDEERVAALFVLSLAHDRIDFERGIARQRALEKRVLEAGRAFDDQHAAPPALRRHEHAAHVVLGDELAAVDGNLDRVDRRRSGDGDTVNTSCTGAPSAAGVTRRVSIGRPFSLSRSSIGAVPKPWLVTADAEIDRRIGQQRLAGRQIDDLAILDAVRRCRRRS